MMEAWRSGGFATYPDLPGWTGTPWSLLLVPGWRELIGRPLGEVAARQWAIANQVLLDDLAALPRERWCAVSYADVVRDPQAVAESLCAFAGLAWDQELSEPLPLSRHTLTPPAPEKWRKNEPEFSAFLPLAEKVAARAHAILSQQTPPPAPSCPNLNFMQPRPPAESALRIGN
jgi:hypothetical protein